MKEKTAEEMFGELGFKPDLYNKFLETRIIYIFTLKNNENVQLFVYFNNTDKEKYYRYYYNITNPFTSEVLVEKEAKINIEVHKAITKQMQELGWI